MYIFDFIVVLHIVVKIYNMSQMIRHYCAAILNPAISWFFLILIVSLKFLFNRSNLISSLCFRRYTFAVIFRLR